MSDHVVRLERRKRRTFCDFYTEDDAYMWVCLISDGSWGFDLHHLEHMSLGTLPTWWDSLEGDEVEQALDIPRGDYGEGARRWMLEEGIAPGQPFRIRFGMPIGTSYDTDCGREYDVEYDIEILEVYQWPPERAAAAHLKARASAHEAKQGMEILGLQQKLAAETCRTLRVVYDSYFAPGQNSGDDMCMPAGISARLESQPDPGGWWRPLAWGKSDKGRREVALRNLQHEVFASLPVLADVDVAKLPSTWRF